MLATLSAVPAPAVLRNHPIATMATLRTSLLPAGTIMPVVRPRAIAQLLSRPDPPLRSAAAGVVHSKRNSVIMRAKTKVRVDELEGLCMSSLNSLGYTRDEASVLTEVRSPLRLVYIATFWAATNHALDENTVHAAFVTLRPP